MHIHCTKELHLINIINITLPLRSLSTLGAVAVLVPLRPAFFTEAPSDKPSATELGEVTRTPANMDNWSKLITNLTHSHTHERTQPH